MNMPSGEELFMRFKSRHSFIHSTSQYHNNGKQQGKEVEVLPSGKGNSQNRAFWSDHGKDHNNG
jgi:hypothetical protein